jgi:type IV pilus assembly protein PilM
MSKKELISAIELEVEQSIPLPAKELYYDYEVTAGEGDQTLVRLVAAPRKIVDSYVAVCDLLKLDLALIQTNIEADAQLCILYEDINDGTPYIILDVGGNTTDIGILDSTLRVTGTVDTGGEKFTKAIAKNLEISEKNAQKIKVSRGLNAGKNQAEIRLALAPHLDAVVDEIKRIQKFYEQRIRPNTDISQIVITGGGANMPGLGDYLTDATRIPTRVSSPWSKKITFGRLEAPDHEDLPRLLSAAGLALTKDSELNR